MCQNEEKNVYVVFHNANLIDLGLGGQDETFLFVAGGLIKVFQ